MSTRKLRYFVAVAEELHFSRAAAKLYVAQQALSKQVRELEDAVGAQLLRRTTRSVELTPAGEVMLAAARHALATLDAGVVAAVRTARGVAQRGPDGDGDLGVRAEHSEDVDKQEV